MEQSITLNLPYALSDAEWAKVLAVFRGMDGWIEDQQCWFVDPGTGKCIEASVEPSGLLITSNLECGLFAGWITKLCAKLTFALGREIYDAQM